MTRIDEIKAELAKFDKMRRSDITEQQWQAIDALELELAKLAPKRKAKNVWRAGETIPYDGWSR